MTYSQAVYTYTLTQNFQIIFQIKTNTNNNILFLLTYSSFCFSYLDARTESI